MHITFVKKILIDGSPCKKCADVEQRLLDSGHIEKIDEIIIADERDINSAGMLLAKKHNMSRAPFFIVQDNEKNIQVFDIYFQLVKEVLEA